MEQEGEEQRKMRPSIPQWWRINSYFHLFVLKSFPNQQASWWLFPRQGLMLLWHTWYVEDRAPQGGSSLKGLGGHRWHVRHQEGECEGWHSSQVLPGWEGPRQQLWWSSGVFLLKPLQRTVTAELQSAYRLFGEGAAFFQQQSGHWTLEADCETTVWEEGVCVQCPSRGPFVPLWVSVVPENLSCFLIAPF